MVDELAQRRKQKADHSDNLVYKGASCTTCGFVFVKESIDQIFWHVVCCNKQEKMHQ